MNPNVVVYHLQTNFNLKSIYLSRIEKMKISYSLQELDSRRKERENAHERWKFERELKVRCFESELWPVLKK